MRVCAEAPTDGGVGLAGESWLAEDFDCFEAEAFGVSPGDSAVLFFLNLAKKPSFFSVLAIFIGVENDRSFCRPC